MKVTIHPSDNHGWELQQPDKPETFEARWIKCPRYFDAIEIQIKVDGQWDTWSTIYVGQDPHPFTDGYEIEWDDDFYSQIAENLYA